LAEINRENSVGTPVVVESGRPAPSSESRRTVQSMAEERPLKRICAAFRTRRRGGRKSPPADWLRLDVPGRCVKRGVAEARGHLDRSGVALDLDRFDCEPDIFISAFRPSSAPGARED